MNSSPSQLNMHYGACLKKAESRLQTIIKAYQGHCKKASIPANSQYWSICGRCSYENGKLEIGCEPDQIIKSKLIQPCQFHGVEIDKEIYNWNKRADKRINWHCGDFYETMVEYTNHNKFNPAIVNADMIVMSKYGSQYLSKIMQFLTTSAKEVMLVGNFVTSQRYFREDINDIKKALSNEPGYQFSMNNGKWRLNKEYYWYNGTGKTRTKMTTIILFKE